MSEKEALLTTKHIFAINAPSAQMRSTTRPFVYRALATFQIIGKVRKQGAAIWIKCVDFSYFHKILQKFTKFIIHFELR